MPIGLRPDDPRPSDVRDRIAGAILAQQGGGPPEAFTQPPGVSPYDFDVADGVVEAPNMGGLSQSQFDDRFTGLGPSYSESESLLMPGGSQIAGANTFRDDAVPSMDPNLDQFTRFGGGRNAIFGVEGTPGGDDRGVEPYGPQNVADSFNTRFNPLIDNPPGDNPNQRAFDVPAAPAEQSPQDIINQRFPDYVTNQGGVPFDEQMGRQFPPDNQGVTNAQYPSSGGFTDETGDLPALPQSDVRQVPVNDMLDVDNLTGTRTPVSLGPQGQLDGTPGQTPSQTPSQTPDRGGDIQTPDTPFFPSLPSLPTGNPNPYTQSPAYESHGGVDYSGRPTSLAAAVARGSVDINSLTSEQLERVVAQIAAGTAPISNRTGRRG